MCINNFTQEQDMKIKLSSKWLAEIFGPEINVLYFKVSILIGHRYYNSVTTYTMGPHCASSIYKALIRYYSCMCYSALMYYGWSTQLSHDVDGRVSLYKRLTCAQISLLTERHRHWKVENNSNSIQVVKLKMMKIKHLGVLLGLLHIIYAVPSVTGKQWRTHNHALWLLIYSMKFLSQCRR